MSLPKINLYEIKMSRTGKQIPVVNDVHLHSIYNPIKEAEGLIENHLEILKIKKEVLILGLGFGYHVNEVIEKLSIFHGDNFRVIVIDPNHQVYNDCIHLNLLNKKNLLVYPGLSPSELYGDLDLVHFLLRKPAIIAHPPSYNLYQSYFKTILSYEAPKRVDAIANVISNVAIKNYLNSFDPDANFEDLLYSIIPKKTKLTNLDFLALALSEMTKKRHKDQCESGEV